MAYSPSSRKRHFQAPYRITKNRIAWMRHGAGSIAVMRYIDPPNDNETASEEEGVMPTKSVESGPTVRVIISKNNGGRPFTLDLSALTAPELAGMKQIFDLAFELAQPVTELRDREAQEAYESGDDSYARIYRPVPQIVIREGKIGEHPQGVRDGSEDLHAGTVDVNLPADSRELRAGSDGLAPEVPLDPEPEDLG